MVFFKLDEVLFQVDIFHGVGSLDELLVEPVKSAPEKKGVLVTIPFPFSN